MPRWVITVTDEMDAAVKRLATQKGTPISNLVRQVVKEYLAENGEQVDAEVTWGGNRKDKLIEDLGDRDGQKG